MTAFYLQFNEREWRKIEAVLPRQKTGRPRKNDRTDIAELLYHEALDRPLYDSNPDNRSHIAAIGGKKRRWQRDGTWPRIVAAGAPYRKRAVRRWHRKLDPQSKLMARLLELHA